MKSINVTELKAHLSKYLRMASRGVRIVVKDRDERRFVSSHSRVKSSKRQMVLNAICSTWRC